MKIKLSNYYLYYICAQSVKRMPAEKVANNGATFRMDRKEKKMPIEQCRYFNLLILCDGESNELKPSGTQNRERVAHPMGLMMPLLNQMKWKTAYLLFNARSDNTQYTQN